MKMIILLFALSATLGFNFIEAVQEIPEGYKMYEDGFYYKFQDQGMTFKEGSDACLKEGAELVIIDNDKTKDIVNSFVPMYYFWINPKSKPFFAARDGRMGPCTDMINGQKNPENPKPCDYFELSVLCQFRKKGPKSWFCSVKDKNNAMTVVAKTTYLEKAQAALGIGNQNNKQAIIPMMDLKAGDPHDLDTSWVGGSIYWDDYPHINRMRSACEKSGMEDVEWI